MENSVTDFDTIWKSVVQLMLCANSLLLAVDLFFPFDIFYCSTCNDVKFVSCTHCALSSDLG